MKKTHKSIPGKRPFMTWGTILFSVLSLSLFEFSIRKWMGVEGETYFLYSGIAGGLLGLWGKAFWVSITRADEEVFRRRILDALQASQDWKRKRVLTVLEDNNSRKGFLSIKSISERLPEENAALLAWVEGSDEGMAEMMGAEWARSLIPNVFSTRGIGRDKEAVAIRTICKRYEGHAKRMADEIPFEALSFTSSLNALIALKRMEPDSSSASSNAVYSLKSFMDGIDTEWKTGTWREREKLRQSLQE